MKYLFAGAALGAAVLALLPAGAVAQSKYPNRPIRFVVPYPPGGGTDFIAREIGHKITEALGQAVVIDNRPGAGATLGHGVGAKAAPDGYTILLGTTGGTVSGPALGVKINYDPRKDFAPIGFLVYVPYTFVTAGNLAPNSMREFIDFARASPGKLNFASPGTGTPNHLGGVMLMMMTKTSMVHVPYKGGALVMNDLLSGQMQCTFSSPPQALPFVKAGRMKMLGVGHPTRVQSLPDVPAINETVPGFVNTGWWGVLAPAGTPREIVELLNRTVNKALVLPDTEKKLYAHGVIAAPGTPQAFRDFIREDQERWGKVIREAKLAIE